ncbi:MAG: hypothetical protein ACTSPM_09580 [Candidatus Heimdallarchaeota archaeon]
MREENLPFELRVSVKRRSFVRSFKNYSWNFRISILLLFFAVVINLALLLSIPVQTRNDEFYYFINEILVGYDTAGVVFITDGIPILRFDLIYTANFHINYWLMIGLFSLIGSGALIRSRSELKMLIRSYYLILSVVLLVGSIKIFIMIGCMKYYVLGNNFELALFLTIYPFVFLLPMHFINLSNLFPSFPINQEILPKKKSLIRIPIMVAYAISLGVLYLAI